MLNAEVHMTKDMYFEMCEQLGQEPVEEEIPLELCDFPDLVQDLFNIYYILRDNWDPMGGSYLGKDYSIVFNLFDLYNIEVADRVLSMSILQHIDGVRSKSITERMKNRPPPTR